jgi:asparagine synthase (glutamine-hydrolysing)
VTIGQTALVHTRLAIIDLAGGDQPLFAGPAALIANGEIYNDPALRAAMPDVGFATGSDCESPLHLWRREGDAYAVHLRGMFAIAIHDSGGRTLTLTRDPFGIKPLYITLIEGGVAFASEPQALLAAGLCPRTLRPAARDELLQLQFTTGAETIFAGIRRVLPGETLRIADGVIVEQRRVADRRGGGAGPARPRTHG